VFHAIVRVYYSVSRNNIDGTSDVGTTRSLLTLRLSRGMNPIVYMYIIT
jgi:hypothetical protein